MKALLVLVALALAGPAQPLRFAPEALEAAKPADLARAVFGDAGAVLTEARTERVRGVAQWTGIGVNFASSPKPSGFGGLCVFDGGSAFFAWHHMPSPGKPDYVQLEGRELAQRFALLSGAPSLTVGTNDPAACARLSPVIGPDYRALAINLAGPVDVRPRMVVPADLAQAVYALRALADAKRRFAVQRCTPQYDLPCEAGTVGGFDLTKAYLILIAPCVDQPSFRCVEAFLAVEGGAHVLSARIDPNRLGWQATPAVESVKLSVEVWPIT